MLLGARRRDSSLSEFECRTVFLFLFLFLFFFRGLRPLELCLSSTFEENKRQPLCNLDIATLPVVVVLNLNVARYKMVLPTVRQDVGHGWLVGTSLRPAKVPIVGTLGLLGGTADGVCTL